MSDLTHSDEVSDERLAEMLAGLEGVTPGEWKPWVAPSGQQFIRTVYTDGEGRRCTAWPAECAAGGQDNARNAAHIARCDPDTIRALVTELQSRRSASNTAGGGVKALNWKEDEPGWWCAQPTAMIGGFGYEVRVTDSGKVRARRGRDDWAAFDGTLEEAKAAAQADFNARILSALEPIQAGGEPVAQTERLKLHRKVMGMIADRQRYAGVMIDGRELHVIAEALLDRAIEVERSTPVSAEVTVTVTDEMVDAACRAIYPLWDFSMTPGDHEIHRKRVRNAITAALASRNAPSTGEMD